MQTQSLTCVQTNVCPPQRQAIGRLSLRRPKCADFGAVRVRPRRGWCRQVAVTSLTASIGELASHRPPTAHVHTVITTVSPVPFVRPSAVFDQVQDQEKPTCYGGVPRCQVPTEGRHNCLLWLQPHSLGFLLFFFFSNPNPNFAMPPPAGSNDHQRDLRLDSLESVKNSTTT